MHTLLDGIVYSDYTLPLSSGRAWNYKCYELTAFGRMSQAAVTGDFVIIGSPCRATGYIEILNRGIVL
jgi:hypothetical protein